MSRNGPATAPADPGQIPARHVLFLPRGIGVHQAGLGQADERPGGWEEGHEGDEQRRERARCGHWGQRRDEQHTARARTAIRCRLPSPASTPRGSSSRLPSSSGTDASKPICP